MALAHNLPRLTKADYLRLERQAEFRSEFLDGEMFAMAGGTRSHSLIATNLAAEQRNLLKGTDCVVYNSGLRVKVEATGLLTYPDVSVVCGEQRFLDKEGRNSRRSLCANSPHAASGPVQARRVEEQNATARCRCYLCPD